MLSYMIPFEQNLMHKNHFYFLLNLFFLFHFHLIPLLVLIMSYLLLRQSIYANQKELLFHYQVKFIRQYKTKQGINNALNKEFKDSKRTSEIYSAIKPLIADKKGK